MTLDIITLQLFSGLSLCSILLLVGIGLSITFGLMGIINFAHGEFLMVGAYTAYMSQKILAFIPGGGYFFVALPLSFLIAGALGFLLEKVLIRYFYSKPYESILATWGLSLILQQLARNIFGANNVEVTAPVWLTEGIRISEGVQLPYNRLFIIGIAFTCLTGLWFYLYKTPGGRRMQAVMQNRSMATCMGINSRKVDALTFAIGSGLAGVAGCIVSLLGSIGPATGQNYILYAFLVVVLGGVGSLKGTIAGALIIGFALPFFEYMTTSSMGNVIVFILIILFLQKRPAGFITMQSRALD
ncbi:urea ABC transporter permease subunit UrtB [Candidatus Haliotispira prima]|uniref:Urea ABC transporter permease subunit UrtB n=1 Tax=Candidatus Haliotispira prima TaxID=3034016 RepID=A0ABY8MJR4_9SPIO|nr:urea ABC transporter permease subunit UrtB [Candidatus Haliotispira prima]